MSDLDDKVRAWAVLIRASALTFSEARAALIRLGLWNGLQRKPGGLRPLTLEVAKSWGGPHSATFLVEHSKDFDRGSFLRRLS